MATENPERVEVKRIYTAGSPMTGEWFGGAVNQIFSYYDPVDYFSGGYTMLQDESEIKLSDFNSWKERIKSNWSQLKRSNCWIAGNPGRIGVYAYPSKSMMEVSVETASKDECFKILTQLEKSLNLTVSAQINDRVFSKNARFQSADVFTVAWYKETISYLTSLPSPLTFFTGSYRFRDYFFGERIEINSQDKWISEVEKDWFNISESGAVLSNENLRINVGFDHQRSLVQLEVNSISIEYGTDIFKQISDHLKLNKIEQDPYRYRKSSATYKIGDWNKNKFIDGTKTMIDQYFKGILPAVKDAFVTKVLDDNMERLLGFTDINAFLQTLEELKESDFEGAFLGFEGPNGLAVGIRIILKDKKMIFQSTVPPNEIEDKIVKFYKEPLLLKLVKGETTGSAISSTNEPKTEKWWLKHLITLIVAFFGTLAVLVNLAKSYFTDYNLQITSPAESAKVVHSPSLLLNWSLWPKDAFIQGPDYSPSASILITFNGDSIMEYKQTQPPFKVALKSEGNYTVEIRPDKKAQPGRIAIEYKKVGADSAAVHQ